MWHTSCFEWLLYRSSKMRILCLYLTRVTMMSKRLYKYCSPRWLSLCRHQMPCSWLLLKAALTCSLILARYFSFLLVLVCQRSMWERGYNLFCDEYLFWETDSSFFFLFCVWCLCIQILVSAPKACKGCAGICFIFPCMMTLWLYLLSRGSLSFVFYISWTGVYFLVPRIRHSALCPACWFWDAVCLYDIEAYSMTGLFWLLLSQLWIGSWSWCSSFPPLATWVILASVFSPSCQSEGFTWVFCLVWLTGMLECLSRAGCCIGVLGFSLSSFTRDRENVLVVLFTWPQFSVLWAMNFIGSVPFIHISQLMQLKLLSVPCILKDRLL